jgi:sugar phosphate isomerase/epimerase
VSLSVAENLALAEKVFPPLVQYAADRGVRLVIENCPMEGWHPDGYPANLAYSPELWDWLAGLGLYLNYDPSHLMWLGIDPVPALLGHLDRVLHVQAKDVEIDAAARNRYGVFGRLVEKPSPWDSGWWRYRIPGRGQVDWGRIVDALYAAGYDGVVSVEHEDPVWGGDPEQVKNGLRIAERTLGPLIVA